MRKLVTVIEVPIYLLVIGFYCFEEESYFIGTFLWLTSIIRLWVNHITWKGE